MSEPENELSAEELEALAAERARPSIDGGAMERMLHRLELSLAVAGTITAATAVAAHGAAASAHAASHVTGPTKTLVSLGLAKAAMVFGLGLVVGGGLVHFATRSNDGLAQQHQAPVAALRSSPASSSSSEAPFPASGPVASPDIPSIPLESLPTAAATASTVCAAPPVVHGAADVAAESQVIDGVRTALARRDGESALTLLRGYDERFPDGSFREESRALAIQALRIEGRADDADKRLSEFRRRYPRSLFLPALAASRDASP